MTRVVIVCLLVAASTAAAQAQVTVLQLLRNPRQFDGRRVTVSGYYESDWEWHLLFADPQALKHGDSSRCIWIEADPVAESPLRKARITGIFIYSRSYTPDRGGGYGPFGTVPAQLGNCMVHLEK